MKEWLRLLGFVRPYVLVLVVSVVLMACVGGAHALIALLIGPVFDRVLNPASADAPVLLFRLPIFGQAVYLNDLLPSWIHNVWTMIALGILAVFLVRGLCDYFGNYLVNYVGYSAVTDLRQTVFDKILRQSAEFFESHSTGRLMSSIMNDIEKIQVATSHILADLMRQIFIVVGLLYVLLEKDWKLALVSLTLLPFVLVPTARIGKRIRRTTRRAQDDTADLNQILQETLSGHQVVRSFGAEAYESRRFRVVARRLRSSNLRYVAQQALSSPLIEFFGALTIVGLLTYARTQIKAGQMTTGEFTTFVVALLMLYEPVKRLTGIHNIFQQALGASQRVFEYLDREEAIQDKAGALPLARFERSIVFDAVSFRYPSSPNGFLLRDISLEVKAGDVVAVVGPSGAGKSTLVSLLPRFYDVTAGAVRVDGHDVRDLQVASLRRMVGIVPQDTFLFNDTVANNIRYGRQDVSVREVEEAARNALCEEFIGQMPEGLDTVIGERGFKLSGGQRQRIAIARALLENAPILILDEATSHLDTESELLVQRALGNLMSGRTVIVIAHRLSTIRRADKIIVLDQGRICEVGTHDELVGSGGIYQRLYELQFLEADRLA
ncbi:MAG TPA: ABC transporter transmembrane domain-containing protein [Bryobacteraceae bacterium]|nr:ABC transporter transmembrane domain-containing protein [Bryobacteraceae bacterium]